MMEPGPTQGFQEKLHGLFSKISKDQLRTKVTDWQKKLVATAASRFSFDSPASAPTESNSNDQDTEIDGNENSNEKPGQELLEESNELTPTGQRPDSLRGEIMDSEVLTEAKLLTPFEELPRNKSPVQQWVDSLIDDPPERRGDDMPPIPESDQNDVEVESFSLGAEAPGVVCPRPFPYVQVTGHCGESDAGSHCSSMESLLESRKPDPEEMLLELGFGGCAEPDIISRIPERFLRPSNLKGVVIDDFIKHQKMMAHQFQSGFSGYRGLTGPSHAMPSGIVGKIMDRLLEAEVGRQNQEDYYRAQQQALMTNSAVQHCQASQTQGGYSPKLARLAHNLMIKMKCTKQETSVLSPENRNWYESQGDKSPEPAGRRLIIGHNSYTFAKDGYLDEDSKGSVNRGIISGPPNRSPMQLENPDFKMNYLEAGGVSKLFNGRLSPLPVPNYPHVLPEMIEESESPPSFSFSDTSNATLSMRTDSALTDTQPGSGVWPSSHSIFTSSEKVSSMGTGAAGSLRDMRRFSLPEVSKNPNENRRRGSLLENRRFYNENRRDSIDRCSSCGSRKTSTDLNDLQENRSRPPTSTQQLNANEDYRQRVPEVTICDNFNELIENFDHPMRSSSDHQREPENNRRPNSLMEEMNLQESVISRNTNVTFVENTASDRLIHQKSFNKSDYQEDGSVAGSSGPSTPSSHSFDQEEAEMEYKNLVLLTNQLQDAANPIHVGTEEEFLGLDSQGRRHLQVVVIEEALRTYQKRLKELDLRGHLRELLTGQLHRVTDLLDSSSAPSVLTIMKQMSTLLRHQEALRRELEFHEEKMGKQSPGREA